VNYLIVFRPVATVKPSRREKTARTRAKILDAAHDEFCERGFHGATVTSIAARAGVAPQTIYFVFHTKAALISAVIDRRVMGDDDPIPPQAAPWWQEMVAAPDPRAALRAFVAGALPVFARAALVSEVLKAAALTDDELRVVHEGHERLRREGFGEVVDGLIAKGSLRAGLDRDRAVDVLLTVLGDGTYVELTRTCGWSDDQVLDWLQEALPRLLLAD
jgi:AcrR family transcriptional regulator